MPTAASGCAETLTQPGCLALALDKPRCHPRPEPTRGYGAFQRDRLVTRLVSGLTPGSTQRRFARGPGVRPGGVHAGLLPSELPAHGWGWRLENFQWQVRKKALRRQRPHGGPSLPPVTCKHLPRVSGPLFAKWEQGSPPRRVPGGGHPTACVESLQASTSQVLLKERKSFSRTTHL